MTTQRIAIALVIALGVVGGSMLVASAEMPPAAVVAQMKSGTITAVGRDEISIDGHSFRIKHEAEILNHKGNPMRIEQIVSTGEVKYLLKAGEIEAMIVTNPQ
jgi:hypothetical protein